MLDTTIDLIDWLFRSLGDDQGAFVTSGESIIVNRDIIKFNHGFKEHFSLTNSMLTDRNELLIINKFLRNRVNIEKIISVLEKSYCAEISVQHKLLFNDGECIIANSLPIRTSKGLLTIWVTKRFSEEINSRFEKLTIRESQCFSYILKGFTAPMIAEKLFISERTVESHISTLKDKLHCKKKADLIKIGHFSNILEKQNKNICQRS